MKTIDKKTNKTIIYIIVHARELFNKLRWPNGVVCPYCGETHIWHYKTGGYKCSKCGRKFSDTSGTLFHSTKVPLSYWLVGLYLITMNKGCSSEELARHLGVTQRTSWFMLHKLRYALKQDATILTGDIAVDEVFLGGKWSSIITPKKIKFLKEQGLWYEGDIRRTWHKKNIRRAISIYKQPVYGMNDGDKIVLQALPYRFNSADILNITRTHSDEHLRHLISDQASYYKDILDAGYDVIQMNHSKGEFRNGEYSSNRIEGTFSHLKRRYRAHYVRPNKKYIQLYLNEFCFRWNHRNDDTISRLNIGISLCTSMGTVTRATINSYNWINDFPERKPLPHYKTETLEEWFERDINWGLVQTIEIQGVEYNKQEFDRLKQIWEDSLYKLDDTLPF